MASTSKLSYATFESNSGALPLDALFEVLLRLPTKDLCRLRVVCRSWRALTSDPLFAAEHKSRHADPLFAVVFRDGDARGVAIVGLLGQVLRRISCAPDRVRVLLTHLDRICVFMECKPSLASWVVNPATGAALALPGLHSDEFVGNCIERATYWGSVITHNCWTVTYAIGQVACGGVYKLLRISHPGGFHPQLCDIITLDQSSHGGWGRKRKPSVGLMTRMETMVVYFLFNYAFREPGSIAPFNLDTEEWMPALRGPEPLRDVNFRGQGHDRSLALASLHSCLVIVDSKSGVSFVIWFLVDHETSLWVKKYRLDINAHCEFSYPLLVLDDGRIVIFERIMGLLQCYDLTTGNLTNVLDLTEMGIGESQSIAVYTGSLLI